MSGAAVWETQATYDLERWSTDVFNSYDVDVVANAVAGGLEQRLLAFYGVDSFDEYNTDAIDAYRAEVDMLGQISADDPPMWVTSTQHPEEYPASLAVLEHSPLHVVALAAAAESVGLHYEAFAPVVGLSHPDGKSALEFAITVFELGQSPD